MRLQRLCKTFVSKEPLKALMDFSCDVADGEFAVILGPSGCGKSTVVRIIAGLEKPSSGTVLVHDLPVTRPGGPCGMVFQSYTSFPWLNVLDNIAFGLRYVFNMSVQARNERAREFAKLVGLESFEHASINQLSGGMKQRVAIASALAADPKILLMDEPFGALDSQTRMVMQEQLLRITKTSQHTVIFVTHDIEEALVLGDRIYVCTARPASVLAEIDVPFPHPRNSTIRNQKQFVDMKQEIFHLLREHVYSQMLEDARERRR